MHFTHIAPPKKRTAALCFLCVVLLLGLVFYNPGDSALKRNAFTEIDLEGREGGRSVCGRTWGVCVQPMASGHIGEAGADEKEGILIIDRSNETPLCVFFFFFVEEG